MSQRLTGGASVCEADGQSHLAQLRHLRHMPHLSIGLMADRVSTHTPQHAVDIGGFQPDCENRNGETTTNVIFRTASPFHWGIPQYAVVRAGLISPSPGPFFYGIRFTKSGGPYGEPQRKKGAPRGAHVQVEDNSSRRLTLEEKTAAAHVSTEPAPLRHHK
jgi:hypothetical protein